MFELINNCVNVLIFDLLTYNLDPYHIKIAEEQLEKIDQLHLDFAKQASVSQLIILNFSSYCSQKIIYYIPSFLTTGWIQQMMTFRIYLLCIQFLRFRFSLI